MPKVPIYVIQAAIPSYINESIICRYVVVVVEVVVVVIVVEVVLVLMYYFPSDKYNLYHFPTGTKVISGTFTNIDQFSPPSPEQLKKMAEKYKFYR